MAADYFLRHARDADGLAAELDTPERRRRYVAQFYGSRFWAAPGDVRARRRGLHDGAVRGRRPLPGLDRQLRVRGRPAPGARADPPARRSNPTPTLILYGPEDHVIPRDFPERMEAAFPERAGPFVVQGAGHFLQWERADVLNGALRWLCSPERLAGHEPRGGRLPGGDHARALAQLQPVRGGERDLGRERLARRETSRTRLPSSVIEVTSASSRFCAEPVGAPGSGGPTSISQGKTLTATAPAPAVGAHDRAAAVELDEGEAVGTRRGAAGEHHRAGEVRHERRCRGAAASSPALPSWTTAPGVDHAHPVAEQRRLREVVRHEQRRDLAPPSARRPARARRSRGCASRAPRAARRAAARRAAAPARGPGPRAGAHRPRGCPAGHPPARSIPKRPSRSSARPRRSPRGSSRSG